MLLEDLILLLILAVAVVGWLTLVMICAARAQGAKSRYDERQIAAQGLAFKWGFFTMMVFFLLDAFITGAFELEWYEPPLGSFVGVVLGLTVYCVFCIFRDAYFRASDSPAAALVSINIIGSCQLFLWLSHRDEQPPLLQDGRLTMSCVYLLFFGVALVIDLSYLLKRRLDRRQTAED